MNPPDMIGQSILSVRYHYLAENPEGLQEFHGYVQLSNKEICTIPVWPLEEITEDLLGLEDPKDRFTSGKRLEQDIAEKIIGKKIVDIYFQKDNGLSSKPAYLELENGYYLTEEPYSSQSVGLRLLTKEEFLLEEGLKSFREK